MKEASGAAASIAAMMPLTSGVAWLVPDSVTKPVLLVESAPHTFTPAAQAQKTDRKGPVETTPARAACN
jgi:hypothetical protein